MLKEVNSNTMTGSRQSGPVFYFPEMTKKCGRFWKIKAPFSLSGKPLTSKSASD